MPLRILMLSWEYPPRVIGGVAPHVRHLSRALVAREHQVTVLAGDHPAAPEVGRDRGVEVHRVRSLFPPPPEFPAEVLQFNLALVEHGLSLAQEGCSFDLIHCHDWLVGAAGRTLKALLGRPLVATIHATEYGRNRGLHNALQHYINGMEWWLGYEAWRVITCSRYMREEVQAVFELPEHKVDVVPNGVDREEFRLAPPLQEKIRLLRERMHRAGQALVLFMGRLVWEKGAQDLIDALPLVRARMPGVRLVVAGDGPLRQELMERAQSRGVGGAVYFPGFVSGARRRQLLALADVAVFPSHYEPFGIVALEAMASGTPVIVGDVGGLAEVVDHGRNGLRVPPRDPVAIADAIRRLLTDPALGRRLTAEGLRDVEARYDWGAIAERTEAVYRRVLTEWSHWRDSPAARAAERLGDGPVPLRSPLSLRLLSRANASSRYRSTGAPDLGVESVPVP